MAYSAGKPEERQICLVNLEKEEAPVQLTHHATPVGEWAWSPDSSRIFFFAPDSADKDEQKRKEKKFDVRMMDPVRPPSHLWSIAIADKTEKRWTSGDAYGVLQFTLSPDGAYAAFRSESTGRHANRLDQADSEIYTLNLLTSEIHRITNNKVGEGPPHFSPDSKWLLFTASDDFSYLRNIKLYVVPVAGGAPRKLLSDWDHSARSPAWSADSKTIYFAEGIGVDTHVFAVSLADGKLTQLTRERGVIGGPGFDYEAGLFLLSFSDPTQPLDYFVARPETVGQRSRWVRVSHANPQVENLHLAEYETLRWKSTDGQMVEGVFAYPIGYEKGKRYPLIVQLHGGPAGAYENNFSGGYVTYVHIYAANGYAVFQPNYRGSDNYGEKFRMQIAGDYFRQGFDDIMTGVDELIARGIADPAKLGMMGWSAGGHWSDWTLTHTDRFKAISTGAGAVNPDRYPAKPRVLFQRQAVGELGPLHRGLAAALHQERQDAHADSRRRGRPACPQAAERRAVHGAQEAGRAGRIHRLSRHAARAHRAALSHGENGRRVQLVREMDQGKAWLVRVEVSPRHARGAQGGRRAEAAEAGGRPAVTRYFPSGMPMAQT